ncbi:MAG: beta-ketoacyl synthase [Flavobacteriaceae bacterium]|jgi:3-oxoacyl-[acyl-carrier-protein] synthase-1|nr:beta-ketoacyl synthase [Flavobacteriaceae bacterium]
MKRIYVKASTCLSSLGETKEQTWQAIQEGKSGIKKVERLGFIEDIYAGQIADEVIEQAWNKLGYTVLFTRLEKMLSIVLAPLVAKQKPTANDILVLASTKGNIAALEHSGVSEADLNAMIQRIADLFGFTTKPIIVCNACVSGILAVSVAKRMMQMEQCQSAYVIAGDELTSFVVSGFNSFQAMSPEPCKPFDSARLGVTLGEAAAGVLLTTTVDQDTHFEIIGEAAIADANHISGPSRTGEGLYLSIQNAMKEANITTDQIDLVSAHGTATNYNDEMESIAFNRCGLATVPTHSLKGYFGHTLGAAGLLEQVMVMESMLHNTLIVSKGFENLGVSQPLNIITASKQQPITIALKTASGFGGSNTALLIAKRKERI